MGSTETGTSCSSSVSEIESESTQVSATGNTSTGQRTTLLDRLKAPQKLELTRKRIIRKNLLSLHHSNLSKKRPYCSTDPKCVTPSNRV